jgi:hypothetical protein
MGVGMKVDPKGARAKAVRKRKESQLRDIRIPKEALPGSVALTHRKCGTKTCHCAEGKGHPLWLLTYMRDGKKHVERIPEEWVEYVQQQVKEGKRFKEGVNQIFVANAELLVLLRKQKQRI